MSPWTAHRRHSPFFCRKHSIGQAPGHGPGFLPLALQSRCSGGPRTSQSHQNASEVCVARYYDPSTGQFLSLDPNVAQTLAPFGYAGDDPVNEVDQSGLVTVGYCGGAAAAFLGAKGFANGCLTRVVSGGPDEIGAVETTGGGGPKLIIGGGVQVAEQISNATSLKELTGPFAYWEVDVQDDEGEGASVVVFTGKSSSDKSIWGIEVGAGLDFNLSKKIPGVPVLVGGGGDYSWAQVFHHWWEWGPADLAWDGVGTALGQPPVQDLLALAEKLLNAYGGQKAYAADEEQPEGSQCPG